MKKKIVSVCLVVCLLATAIIGTTLAYFTDTAEVTNTFTVGDVTITMDETKIDEDGLTALPEAPRVAGNEYHLLPGHTYTKDPTIDVGADSEACYVFVKVVNGLSELEATGNTIADQMEDNGWTSVSGVANVYVYTGEGADPAVVNGGADLVVFETFTIDTAETAGTLAEADEVVITAYAIQAEGMSGKSAAELWAAGQFV